MDILERGLAAKNFAMLGLGDIVIPGAQKLRFCSFQYEQCFFIKYWIPIITTFHEFYIIFHLGIFIALLLRFDRR